MAWQFAVAKILAGAYQGAEAAKAGDRDADAIDDIIKSTLATSIENKNTVTKDSYAEILNTKDTVSGEISNALLQGRLQAEDIISDTGGSGVLADTGGTLDMQMSALNQSRQQEDALLTLEAMEKDKIRYERDAKKKSIERNTQMEIQRLQAQQQATRQAGKDAKQQAYFGAFLSAGKTLIDS